MTDKQILEKVIKKAVDNGYRGLHYQYEKAGIPFGVVLQNTMKIIFSHNFAISFWGKKDMREVDGEKLNEEGDATYYTLKKWQYHIQQLVLEKEPLLYLENFLEK